MARASAKAKHPSAEPALRNQYAALCWRDDGELEILLITSRETRRWLIPKGWPIAGRQPWDSAAREALEEAGVEGAVGRDPLGTYVYDKRMAGGVLVPCSVAVYPLKFVRQRKNWPEKDQREQQWFKVAEAIETVQEQGLKQILRAFAVAYRP
jgi:8-oxo-dGTP pyrophosphatase MutT (NUDIX family)